MNIVTKKILCDAKSFRYYSTNSKLKVTVCGSSGCIGEKLCLLLKQSPFIDELALYDKSNTNGVAAELQHIDTNCKVVPYGANSLADALKNASIVTILVGPPTTTSKDMAVAFDQNAIVVKEMMQVAAKFCPKAMFAIATAPVEGLVPLAAEVMKQRGVYDPKAMFGVTTMHSIRANTYVAEAVGLEPECVMVPTLGGNTGDCVIPVLSQAVPFNDFTEEELKHITAAVQNTDNELSKISRYEGGALSGAFAIARFIVSLVKALKGLPNIVECAYVRQNLWPQSPYMTLPINLGPNGAQKFLDMTNVSQFEKCMLDQAFPCLREYDVRARCFMGLENVKPCDPCDGQPDAPECPEDACELQRKLQ